jgi:hypothetical protein
MQQYPSYHKPNTHKFLSKVEGVPVKYGNTTFVENSYEIWEDENNNKYVKMDMSKKCVLFDYDDLEKIINKKTRWYIGNNGQGYAVNNKIYMHHIVTDFKGSGKGTKNSIDHINREKLDNRKVNLRHAGIKEQIQNSKGIIPGTKRDRKYNAIEIPEELNKPEFFIPGSNSPFPSYVCYQQEKDGEKIIKKYIVIRDHLAQKHELFINNEPIRTVIKSHQSVNGDIVEKYKDIMEKTKILDEVYRIYQETGNKNIKMEESKHVYEILHEIEKEVSNRKAVIKYDSNGKIIAEYKSLTEAATAHDVTSITIKRKINGNVIHEGYYFKFA